MTNLRADAPEFSPDEEEPRGEYIPPISVWAGMNTDAILWKLAYWESHSKNQCSIEDDPEIKIPPFPTRQN